MNKPPSWTSREESLLLLNAYLDNELDAASVLDVERRIASDATLKSELARLVGLRNALSSHVGKERASDALRRRSRGHRRHAHTQRNAVATRAAAEL